MAGLLLPRLVQAWSSRGVGGGGGGRGCCVHHVAGEGRTGEAERAGLADASSFIEFLSNFPGPQRAMKHASGVAADGAGYVSGSAPPCQRVPHGAARQIAADRSWTMRRFHECQGGGRSRSCSSRHSPPFSHGAGLVDASSRIEISPYGVAAILRHSAMMHLE